MSPAQFIAFINDLLDELNYKEESNVETGHIPRTAAYAFADDLIIHTTDIMGVKKALKVLFDWCERNYIEINLKKCGIFELRQDKRTPRE